MTSWFEFRASHPAAAGHFPGDPIAPAALILCEVLDAARSLASDTAVVAGIDRAKFVSPLRPGERCAIDITVQAPHQLDFTCRVEERLIAQGVILLSLRSQPTPA